jgi:hypothetical protein
MAFVDATGALVELNVVASAGYNEDWVYEDEAGDPFDLTGYTITCFLKDMRGDKCIRTKSIGITVTDAGNGQFDFIIPSTEFTYEEGTDQSYELILIDSSGNREALASGPIYVKEVL